MLDLDDIRQVFTNAVEQIKPQILVRDFAAAKTQGHFHFVAITQEAANVAQLDVVVAIVRAGAEFDFLDFDDRLPGLGFGGAFLFLVLELAVVDQAADRRAGRCGDFNQVHIHLARHAQRFLQGKDAQGLVVRAVQAHFGRGNFTVEPVGAFFALAAVTKVGSYGDYLRNERDGKRRRAGIQLFAAMSCNTRLAKACSGMTPRSALPLPRTATVLASFSLSPTTRIKGGFCSECSRIL